MSIPNPTSVPQPLGDGRYDVPSFTHPARDRYEVNIPGLSCTCRAFEFRGNCKHLDFILDIERAQQETARKLRADIEAQRRERARTIDLAVCQTCHSHPAAPGRAECGFCLMDAVFGERVS